MPSWDPATSTLRNPFMSVRVEPRHGGRIVSLRGPAGELARSVTATDLLSRRVPYKFGLLSLQLWQDSYWHNDLCHEDWVLTGTSTGRATVEVGLSGASRLWGGVAVTRTFRLSDDPWLDVTHRLDPGVTSLPYSAPSFWFANAMRGRGMTYVPGPTGVVDYPRFPQGQSWCHEPTDGWLAWVSGVRGLAFVTEPTQLRHVRVLHHGSDQLDWIRRRVDTVEQADVRLIPFRDLTRVDGVGLAGVVGVRAGKNSIAIEVYPLRSGQAQATVWMLDHNGGEVPFGSTSFLAEAGRRVRVVVTGKKGAADLAVGWQYGSVMIRPRRSGQVTTEFRVASPQGFGADLRAVVPGFDAALELPRAESSNRRPPRSFRFDAVPVPLPELSLVRPPAVRLRVLAFAPTECGPTLQCLAQRFNLDITQPFVPNSASMPTGIGGISTSEGPLRYELGDRYEGVLADELIATWSAALSPLSVYDVILLNTVGSPNRIQDPWSLLPQSLQVEVVNRVQSGTGLVVTHRDQPGGPTPATITLNNLLPLEQLATNVNYQGPWRPLNDRTVRGLPWPVMAEPGVVYRYAVRPAATLLLQLLFQPPEPQPPELMPFLARTQLGAGRILDLAWGHQLVPSGVRPRPQQTDGFDSFRYDLDLLGRIVYDAANRPPAIAVQDVSLVGTRVTIVLEPVTAPIPAFDIDWQSRDRFGAVLGSGRLNFTALPTNATANWAVPSGSWTCDVVVTPSVGDVGWGAGAQILNVPVEVTPPRKSHDRSEGIQVTAALPVGATRALVELLDGRCRVVQRVELLPVGATLISLVAIETPYAELRVHALDGSGLLIAQGYRRLAVRMRSGLDQWPVHFWNSPMSLPLTLQVRRLDTNRALGVSAYFPLQDVAGSLVLIEAADRIGVPYAVESSPWLTTSGGQTEGGAEPAINLTDNAATVAGQASDKALAATLIDSNVLYYRIAHDEPKPPGTNVCFAPRTLEWFRTWLAPRYGHSDALLRATWRPGESLNPLTLTNASPPSYAASIGHFAASQTYAPWVDHRRFMMDLYCTAPAEAQAALRQADPAARISTSAENYTGLSQGNDWWLRGRALDIVAHYATSTRIELAELGTPCLTWTGYDDPDPFIRYRIAALLGVGVSGAGIFAESTLINPDLSLPEVGRDLAAALLPVRRGIGTLFAQTDVASDGILVMSSPDSSIVLAIHGYEELGPGLPQQPSLGTDAREKVHELLATLGVGWRAISPSDVETGKLERERARVLILPMCAALSDAACEAIGRWVERGGCLIADLLAGTFTNRGVLRGTGIGVGGRLTGSTNPLDPVFGLTVGAKPTLAADTVSIDGAAFPLNCVDPAALVTSAASVATSGAGRPLWFLHARGLGAAAYLGCSFFSDFPTLTPQRWADRLSMQTAFARLLEQFGVPSRALVTTNGSRVPSCTVWVRQFGAAELTVLARNYHVSSLPVEPDVDAMLQFRGVAHTYDLDEGTYLGEGTKLALRLGRYTYRIFARLPYRVLAVDVLAVPSAVLGDPITVSISVRTTAQVPGTHLVRFDVLDEQGRALSDLGRELTTQCCMTQITVQTAHNDPAGRWTFVVVDILSGIQGKAQVALLSMGTPVTLPTVNRIAPIDD